MWDRFTPECVRALTIAYAEAARVGSEYVRTEHVLLGMCRSPECMAAQALARLGVDVERLADELRTDGPVMEAVAGAPPDELKFGPRAADALRTARESSAAANGGMIDTGRLLAGLLAAGDGMAARVLADMRIDTRSLDAALAGMAQTAEAAGGA